MSVLSCAACACLGELMIALFACRSDPERFMARRPSPAGPGWDVLIKWTHLGHEHATWEVCSHVEHRQWVPVNMTTPVALHCTAGGFLIPW